MPSHWTVTQSIVYDRSNEGLDKIQRKIETLHKRRKDGFNARKGYDGDLLRNTLCKRAHGTDLIQGSILPFELEDIIDVV